jgi:alginate O-acetyltransferase complex protein AlgI
LVLFALSGFLHELAISFPAGGGWGLPLGYFLLQGVLVAVEERFRIVSRAWTWFWLIAPAPWLFHEPFRRALIVPFYRGLHSLIAQNSFEWYLSIALYAAAVGHLVILIGSFSGAGPSWLEGRHCKADAVQSEDLLGVRILHSILHRRFRRRDMAATQ